MYILICCSTENIRAYIKKDQPINAVYCEHSAKYINHSLSKLQIV
jgi:hypothetical protein